jgi:hypothetical protein
MGGWIDRWKKGTTTIGIMTLNKIALDITTLRLTSLGHDHVYGRQILKLCFSKPKYFFLSFPPKITFFKFFFLIENAGACSIKLFGAVFNLPLY